MPHPGDRIRLSTKKEVIEGILMPSSEQGITIIKLDTGYNLGLQANDIVKMQVLEKAKGSKTASPPKTKPSTSKNLPTIVILHTGGTIASKVDYRTGGVVASFTPEDLLRMFPELASIANFDSELIAEMWSDDLRFGHFALIAKKIEEHIKKGVSGIIIGMGTDNLAVASAALSFIIEKTPIPIIVVGSQRSSDRGSSDAAMNLICAATFITKTDFAGVAICMHESEQDTSCVILPACKTYKLHSSRRDAFKAINAQPIARVDYKTRTVSFLSKDFPKRSSTKAIIKPNMEDQVGLLKIHVNMFPEQFEFFQGYKGLVLEGTGLGHTPGQVPNPLCEIHKKIYPAIKKVIDSGGVVVMCTQTLFGGVNLNVYDKGRDLLKLGVISGKDMLANTALVKLSWLLGNYPQKEVEQLITKNMHGEINERLGYVEDFVQGKE